MATGDSLLAVSSMSSTTSGVVGEDSTFNGDQTEWSTATGDDSTLALKSDDVADLTGESRLSLLDAGELRWTLPEATLFTVIASLLTSQDSTALQDKQTHVTSRTIVLCFP